MCYTSYVRRFRSIDLKIIYEIDIKHVSDLFDECDNFPFIIFYLNLFNKYAALQQLCFEIFF